MTNLAVCLQCGAILHSTHRHDYVVCGCPNMSMVDGGDDYHRRGGKDLSLVKSVQTLHEAAAVVKALGK